MNVQRYFYKKQCVHDNRPHTSEQILAFNEAPMVAIKVEIRNFNVRAMASSVASARTTSTSQRFKRSATSIWIDLESPTRIMITKQENGKSVPEDHHK